MRTAVAMGHFENGRFDEARLLYDEPETTGSEFLSAAESGMAALAGGDWDAAQDAFHEAADTVQAIEDRALVSATDLGESVLSLAINESVKGYEGEGYERVMVHAALAMTYLAQGELDGVWVEVQRANKLLESEEALYEKQYAAGGLGHFISAVAYELFGELNDAYIDYARMEEKGVGTELAGRALVRLGTILRREDQLPTWIERYGPATEVPEDAASVVLIAGLGVGPYKVEHALQIPLPKGIVQWAVPQFVTRPQPVRQLELEDVGTGTVVESVLVEDVATVSAENLEDRIGWLAAKSAVRATLKYQLTRELTEDHGLGGLIAGALFTAATERADLRAWQTLPDSWHGARLFVEPGVHELSLAAVGGERVALGTFELEAGETMIVLARTLGTRIYAHPIGGRPVVPASRLTATEVGESAPASPALQP